MTELMMERGFITRVWGVAHFAPPLIATTELIDRIIAISDESLTIAEREFAAEITD